MSERKDADTDYGKQRLGPVMRHGHGAGHHAETKTPDGAWHAVTMLNDAAAQCDRTHDHRQPRV